MRRPSEPPALPAVSDVLHSLSDAVSRAEDDLLASLVVLGEPDAQRTVDGWVDHVVDLLRAVDEVAGQHRATLARAQARQAPDDDPVVVAPADDSTHVASNASPLDASVDQP
ncbi:hypothetical protein [Knoellia sp. LjRoot47]|uniref:hypothetical protein n=1 Tax=Knoellia sp. LjRoot47 TaxID=3342330 RepID=UPI003ECD5F73